MHDDTISVCAVASYYTAALHDRITDPVVPSYLPMVWEEAGLWFRAQALTLSLDTGITIRPTDKLGVPYASASAMALSVRETGEMLISSSYCDHQGWTPADNMAFRYLHDMTGHLAGPSGPAPGDVPQFDTAGEMTAWAHTYDYLKDHRAPDYVMDVAFSEAVGQTAYLHCHGKFPTIPGTTVQPIINLRTLGLLTVRNVRR
jgi:hypothetical protein